MFDEIDILTIAFSVQTLLRIADADEVLDYTEIEHLGALYSDELLREMGFIDEAAKFTDLFREKYDKAVATLARELDTDRKLALVAQFYDLARADDDVERRELAVVREAARTLGLTTGQTEGWLTELGRS